MNSQIDFSDTFFRSDLFAGIEKEELSDIFSLGHRIRYLELQTERVEQRIARSLLRIMKQSGRKTDEGILIDFRLGRQDLANYTGSTLYTVSRTLSNWEKKAGSHRAASGLL